LSLVPKAPASGPLVGVKVLDLTRIAAGPFATMVLSDMGASVIKVERPGEGDDVRLHGSKINGESAVFIGLNRGKKSIALDLRSPDDRPLVEKLMRWADVVAENFRPGVAQRLAVDFESVRAVNPSIVYLSISGFGPKAAHPDRPAFDVIGQALSGTMDITGEPDRPPSKSGAPIADLTTGAWAAMGVIAALYHRAVTGQGQRVETSLTGATLTHLASYLPDHFAGTKFARLGSRHSHLAPYQAFTGSDGRSFVVAAGTERFWQVTAEITGRPDLISEPRFATNKERIKHRDELASILQESFAKKTADEWLESLRRENVPVCPVYTFEDVIADPDYRSNGYIADMDHPIAGRVPVVMTPLEFSKTPVMSQGPSPSVDQHGAEVRSMFSATATGSSSAGRR
jgi:crotonobetainyl-CoA:carnitine CoA-transferase CaiB-like acyl-CoA transferase